jgi:hypothetical protein
MRRFARIEAVEMHHEVRRALARHGLDRAGRGKNQDSSAGGEMTGA